MSSKCEVDEWPESLSEGGLVTPVIEGRYRNVVEEDLIATVSTPAL